MVHVEIFAPDHSLVEGASSLIHSVSSPFLVGCSSDLIVAVVRFRCLKAKLAKTFKPKKAGLAFRYHSQLNGEQRYSAQVPNLGVFAVRLEFTTSGRGGMGRRVSLRSWRAQARARPPRRP